MINQPEQIVARVRELRAVLDIPAADAAAALGVDERTYLDYESGALDLPINALYKLAELFRVDVTELLTGESPRMAAYTVVRAGKGAKVDRYPGYDFESLAANFRHRKLEPMLVHLSPHADEAHEPALVQHAGEEFNYVLQGTVRVIVGGRAFELGRGDSIYFNASLMHGQRAVGGPAVFLTIIQN